MIQLKDKKYFPSLIEVLMSLSSAVILTSYLQVLFALLALLLVIPQASAASNKIKPGWRAWVWPLVFFGLLVQNGTEATALAQNLDKNSFLWQFGDLAACFSLTMLVLNSVHRVLDNAGAHRFTMAAWGLYLFFSLAIIGPGLFPGFVIYEVLCAIGLSVFYARLYLKERERAGDAIPVIAGVAFLLIYASFQVLAFNWDFGFLSLNQAIFSHIAGIIALITLFIGASNSYTLKYAAQRRRDRDQPSIEGNPPLN